jgi:hypothetical protein
MGFNSAFKGLMTSAYSSPAEVEKRCAQIYNIKFCKQNK